MAKKKVFKLDPVWFGQVWRGMTADQRNYIRDCHQLSGKVLFRLWNSDAPSKWDAITGPTWEPDTAYWPYSDELWAAIQVYNYDHNMNKLHEVLFMTKKHPVLDPARKGTPWGEMTDEERLGACVLLLRAMFEVMRQGLSETANELEQMYDAYYQTLHDALEPIRNIWKLR